MSARIVFDTTEFQKATKQMLLESSRELSVAINARIFYLFVRFFVILPPKHAFQKRQQVREYLNHKFGDINRFDKKIGKRIGKKRLKDVFSRVHKIVQAKRGQAGEPGLYGEAMKKAAASFRRRAIGSVGYLKSGVAKAIAQLNGHFIQTSTLERRSTKTGKIIQRDSKMNSALLELQDEYGIIRSQAGSVSRHRGTWAKSRPARPGLNPSAFAAVSVSIKDDQYSKVEGIMNAAFQRAMTDEHAAMVRHLTGVMQSVADDHNAK